MIRDHCQKSKLWDRRVAARTDGNEDYLHQPVAPTMLVMRKSSCSCGGGCPACHSNAGNLRISQPTDAAEVEADQIAGRVMRMPVAGTSSNTNNTKGHSAAPALDQSRPVSAIHRKCDACEDDEEDVAGTIQRKEALSAADAGPPGGDVPPSIKSVIDSAGSPLDARTRAFFEPRFGIDLSQVRIHTDLTAGRSASAIDARAYTLGNHIVFGRGEYSPQTDAGRHLIAHEIAHIPQQAGFDGVARKPEPGVIHRKEGAGSGIAQIKLLSYEEAAAVLGNEIRASLDESTSAMTVIAKTLDMPFTNENSNLRLKRLVAAISLLNASDAAAVYRALTTPANEKQEHLKDRFGKLSSRFRRPLLDLLQQKAIVPSSNIEQTPQPAETKYQEGKATWVEMHPGVFGYVPESGMTLKKVASYLSGNPHLPAGLSKLNSNIPVDKPLEAGLPVIVPIELIDRDQAIGEMSQTTRQQIGTALQTKADASRVERMIRVKPGPLGPGMYGPLPVTGMAGSRVAEAVAEAVKALWNIIKGAAYGIAFAGGIVHGFFASLWDTVSGIAKMIYDLIDSIISRDLISDIKKFIGGLKQLTMEKVKEMIGDWATKWHEKLNSSSAWVAGHAHGYLTGYVMAEAAMLLLSGGTTAGLKAAFWTSRIGVALKASRPFIVAEQKVAELAKAGGKMAEVIDKVRDSRVGAAVKTVEKVVEVAGWTAKKIGDALSLPGDIAVWVIDKALTHAKELGPFFDRIGKLPQYVKKFLFGCKSPCVWDPDTLAKLMTRFADEEIDLLCRSSNRADLMDKKWFDKTVKVNGDLPEGYHWRGEDIVRNPGKRKADYAPLSYDKPSGKIKVSTAGERISNPSVMNRNYRDQVREKIKERYKGKKLTDKDLEAKVAKEVGQHAVHHLIPDNLVQDHPLGKAARKAGYDLDRGTNLQGLRKNQGLTDKDAGDIGHWSSHPKYDKLVEDELNRVQKALEKEFKSLDKVPNNRMLDEIRKIEDKFRKRFEKSTVPIDPETGRLVEVSPDKVEDEEEERAYV